MTKRRDTSEASKALATRSSSVPELRARCGCAFSNHKTFRSKISVKRGSATSSQAHLSDAANRQRNSPRFGTALFVRWRSSSMKHRTLVSMTSLSSRDWLFSFSSRWWKAMYPARTFWEACTCPCMSKTIWEFMSLGTTASTCWGSMLSRGLARRGAGRATTAAGATAPDPAARAALAARAAACRLACRRRYSSKVMVLASPSLALPEDRVSSATFPLPRRWRTCGSLAAPRAKCWPLIASGSQYWKLCFQTPFRTPSSS
mmetsp:Transcript_63428/g.177532  ORF Transcript_63428/g.177532 Transcript_63428/m.177532 type:complete len:260 (+) Transcript_63428:705-1484(+)